VIAAFCALGFELVREREDIAMRRPIAEAALIASLCQIAPPSTLTAANSHDS
jgi:hypothetical protein